VSKTLLAATTMLVTLFFFVPLGARALAMPLAPPALGLAGASVSMLSRVAIVCGVGGCAPISVKRVWHPPRGFVQRAAPLNMPRTTPPPQQNASANKQ
jgi:hypothetical protein